MSSPSRNAGQVLMIGFEGPPDAACKALGGGRAGGAILFSRNVESADQVLALTARIREASSDWIPIGIDQEGGRVARLDKAGMPAGPPARAIAAAGGPAAAYRWGSETGAVLARLGIDLDFAPVLDVDTNPDNPIIGDRAWGDTPETVIAHAREAARGLREAGVTTCGKHFPGHGDTLLDSHKALPRVTHGVDRLEAVELAPFAALAGELDTIMTAHVVYPAWDPEHPATLSRNIVTGILRERLGFSGVIISDDLEMAAVAELHPPEELAVLALEAGIDLLLACRIQEVWERAWEGLVREAERSPAFAARLADAAHRVRRVLVERPR